MNIDNRIWKQDEQDPRIIIGGTHLGHPLSLLGLNKDGTAIVFEEDDARLVAAAPDLLRACHTAMSAIQKVANVTDETRMGWALKELDAAFTKGRPKPIPQTIPDDKILSKEDLA